jgi:hypothetical protein
LQKTGEWWFYTSTSTWKTAYAFTFANWANSVKIDVILKIGDEPYTRLFEFKCDVSP